ncbi:hypothetical protein [Roseomonas fluvialis]|nr:hypothetical protein [Roseomonas fluvialis]
MVTRRALAIGAAAMALGAPGVGRAQTAWPLGRPGRACPARIVMPS